MSFTRHRHGWTRRWCISFVGFFGDVWACYYIQRFVDGTALPVEDMGMGGMLLGRRKRFFFFANEYSLPFFMVHADSISAVSIQLNLLSCTAALKCRAQVGRGVPSVFSVLLFFPVAVGDNYKGFCLGATRPRPRPRPRPGWGPHSCVRARLAIEEKGGVRCAGM